MSFTSQIASFVKKTDRKIQRAVELFFVDFTNQLIGRTPVGDPSLWQDPPPPSYKPGTLINSWFTTIGSRYSGSVREQNTSGASAISQAREVAKVAAGNLVFITNPTPYVNMIEYVGWSTQAPNGMARITVVEFDAMVRKAVNSVK